MSVVTCLLVSALGAPSARASLAGARAPARVRPVCRMSATASADSTLALAREAMSSLMAAIRQGNGAALSSGFSDGIQVAGPVWTASSRSEWEREISAICSFLIDPSLEVFSVEPDGESAVHIEWLASGTWPLPWRPRALALGSSRLEFEPQSAGTPHVVRMTDKLHTSLPEILLTQLLPNWEDVYSLYNSPPAELRPYRVLRKAKNYELRWLPPSLAIQCELRSGTYPSEGTYKLASPVLPDFAFVGKPLSNKATWSAVRPIAIECDQSARAAGGPCTYRWTLPLPSRLGSDEAQLPPLPPVDADVEAMAYVRVPARHVAVRRIAGIFDSDGALLAEANKFAAELRSDGVAVAQSDDGASSSPTFQFRQYNCKVGYNPQGELAIAQYQGTVEPIRRNEILFDIDEPR